MVGVNDGFDGESGQIKTGMQDTVAFMELEQGRAALQLEAGNLLGEGGGERGEMLAFERGKVQMLSAAVELEQLSQVLGRAEGLGMVWLDRAQGKLDAETAWGFIALLLQAEHAAKAIGELSGKGAEGERGSDTLWRGDPALRKWSLDGRVAGAALPLARGAEQLLFVTLQAEQSGGGGLLGGGAVAAVGEVLKAKGRGDFGIEAGGKSFGCREGVITRSGGVFHDSQKKGPSKNTATVEAGGAGIRETGALTGSDDATALVQTAATGAAEHLQEFVRAEAVLTAAIVKSGGGDVDAAHREVDACSESHGGGDDAQLTGFGQRLDDTSAGGVGEAAVVVGDAVLQQLGEFFAADSALLGRELKGISLREFGRELAGDGFGFFAPGGKDEQGGEVGEQDRGGEFWPIAVEMAGHALGEGDVGNVLQRYRALLGGDDFGGAAEVA